MNPDILRILNNHGRNQEWKTEKLTTDYNGELMQIKRPNKVINQPLQSDHSELQFEIEQDEPKQNLHRRNVKTPSTASLVSKLKGKDSKNLCALLDQEFESNHTSLIGIHDYSTPLLQKEKQSMKQPEKLSNINIKFNQKSSESIGKNPAQKSSQSKITDV